MLAQTLPPEAALFLKYHRYMLKRALRFVPGIDDAEDIVSACWLSLLARTPMLLQMEERRQCAYIMACVRNRAIDFQRRRRCRPAVSLDNCPLDIPDPGSGNPFELVLLRETAAQLISLLPEAERRVVELKLRERSDADISVELHISPITVRLHWHRAQQRLRTMVQNME